MRGGLRALGLVVWVSLLAGPGRGAANPIDGLRGASISEKPTTYAFPNDTRGSVPAREITLSYQAADRVERVLLLVPTEPAGQVVPNIWDATDRSKNCRELYGLAKALANRAGFAARDPWDRGAARTDCGWGAWRVRGGEWDLELRPTAPSGVAQCDAATYLGAWFRPGTGGQSPQVRLVFDTADGAAQPVGRALGFRSLPYAEGAAVVSRIEAPKACSYRAQCAAPLSSANPCTLTIDPAAGTLRITGGAQMFVSDVVWTRSAPPAKPEACQASDIEGNWTRSDGAQITVAGTKFKDGGNALLFNHPDGNWPKGAFKFSAIKPDGDCQWTAQCATIYRDAGNGAYNTQRSACALTVDPKTRTLTASGTHGVFTR